MPFANRAANVASRLSDLRQKQIEALTATVQKVSDQIALSKPSPQLVANPWSARLPPLTRRLLEYARWLHVGVQVRGACNQFFPALVACAMDAKTLQRKNND